MAMQTEARSVIDRTYYHNGRIILSPGKFENCAIWVPYFWNLSLLGLSDALGGHRQAFATFRITPEDREAFPELPAKARKVRIWEDDNGFVYAATH